MISGIGSGMPSMPSMDGMRQMQQRMFNRSDADGSGGLDAAEFGSMIQNSPMGGQGPGGVGADDAFRQIDGDGNGELSQVEMEAAQEQMMARFQSTVQMVGTAGTSSGSGTSAQSSLDTLLKAMTDRAEPSGQDRRAGATGAGDEDLTSQLRSLIDQLASTYNASGFDGARSLMATA